MDNDELKSYKKTIENDIFEIEYSNIDETTKEHIISVLKHSIVVLNAKKTISDDLETLASRVTTGNISHCQGTLRSIAYTVKTIL